MIAQLIQVRSLVAEMHQKTGYKGSILSSFLRYRYSKYTNLENGSFGCAGEGISDRNYTV